MQAGVVSRHQALNCGSTRDAVRWAVRKGAWQQVCPGVYATFTGFRDRYYERYGRLVVELDGRLYHADERAGHYRLRDNQAAAMGGSTLRYDWSAVTRRACETAAEVFAALRERGYRGTLKPCSRACRAVVPAPGRIPGEQRG